MLENKYIYRKIDKNKLPKIILVTPNYNNDKFLEATMLSVLDQGYPNLEYVVMDGGSTDNSVEIIKKYENSLHHWQSEKDEGQYDALNKGFQLSNAGIMGWLNSDDMLHRNALWTIADIFKQLPEVNWLLGQHTKFNSNGQCYNASKAPLWSKSKMLRGQWQWIQQESTYWRSNLWKRAGAYLDTNYKYAADFELWSRFFRYSKLYVTTALIGGFRTTSQEQKGRKYRNAYINEVNKAILREKDKYPFKTTIGFLEEWLRFSAKILPNKFKNSLNHYLNKKLEYSPVIKFNEELNRYYIDNSY